MDSDNKPMDAKELRGRLRGIDDKLERLERSGGDGSLGCFVLIIMVVLICHACK